MTPFGLPVTCPTCSADVNRIITQAPPNPATGRAVIACPKGYQWLLNINLTPGPRQ